MMKRKKSRTNNLGLTFTQLEDRKLLAADLGVSLDVLLPVQSHYQQSYQAQSSSDTLEYRAIDGTGNNLAEPELGSTHEQLLRGSAVEYEDGISTPAGADRVSAREISNEIVTQTTTEVNDRGLTDLVWVFGQFIDHDLDLTESATPEEDFSIEVPTGDVFFDPFGTGEATISLTRAIFDTDTGTSTDNPREQINEITAFLDGSVVYGSDEIRAAELRTFSGGLLKTSEGDLLPFNEAGLSNAGGTGDTLFLAGDVRANENVALLAMHTVWVREHNFWAEKIASEDPSLSDEEVYQQAKAIVTAELQAITYNEFLPALLGEDALSDYNGYDETVDPGINNEFSGAAYRFGHSMLSTELLRLNDDGTEADEGHISLQDAFFSPDEITENGIDSILAGVASQVANEIDNQVVDDIRNFLFGPPGAGGFDLASLNIQRGRDLGLADYNQVREDFGLERVTSFDEISSDPEVAAKLEELYGSVDNIDLWVGGLAEDHVDGSSMGELFSTIIVDQFERIRTGDRLWYENVFSDQQVREINQTSLSDVIARNTELTNLHESAFFIDGVDPADAGGDDGGKDREDKHRNQRFDSNRFAGDRHNDHRTNDRRSNDQTNRKQQMSNRQSLNNHQRLNGSEAQRRSIQNEQQSRNQSDSNGRDSDTSNRGGNLLRSLDAVFAKTNFRAR